MNMDEYQKAAHAFATAGGDTLAYSLLGLGEEVGELLAKTNIRDVSRDFAIEDFLHAAKSLGFEAKEVRKTWGNMSAFTKNIYLAAEAEEGAAAELGDCLWMIANVAHHLGLSLSDVAAANLAKLNDRAARGVIVGEGDNR